ncbi:hypothetical protein V1264_001901 [Littorina saxatilis]|uniref:Uncharacterized protein n=1 Tax=Littorina saxatilis TaxID=31220 RepID=A0AAN9C2R4_9CAEN
MARNVLASTKLITYLMFVHHAFVILSTVSEEKREILFTIHRHRKLSHESCVDTSVCSHMSCAMVCMRRGHCEAFVYLEFDNGTRLCQLCSQFYEEYLLPGMGIVGATKQIVAADCSRPKDIPGTDVTYAFTSANSIASYRCKADHTQISGNGTSVCLRTGAWSTVSIACVETGCYFHDRSLGHNWYTHTVSVTKHGVTCQKWDVDTPHTRNHELVTKLEHFPIPLDLDNNYCRIYPDRTIPWCYTTDPGHKSDDCGIPACPPPVSSPGGPPPPGGRPNMGR